MNDYNTLSAEHFRLKAVINQTRQYIIDSIDAALKGENVDWLDASVLRHLGEREAELQERLMAAVPVKETVEAVTLIPVQTSDANTVVDLPHLVEVVEQASDAPVMSQEELRTALIERAAEMQKLLAEWGLDPKLAASIPL